MIELQSPEALRVGDWTGGSQKWYPTWVRRMSGCGPTNAALQVWYLARTRAALAGLCEVGAGGKAEFQRLMADLFPYVKPGRRGVDTPEKFSDGLERYCAAHGVSLSFAVLPDWEAVPEALRADLPVAFLNLHSGSQKHMDDWHWLTLVACDPARGAARCCDQGRTQEFSLRDWAATTKRGGAFVALNPTKSFD
ncbi:MAG: hypothetical protein LBJ11_09825 [Oscillospiraceae bacterium]|jgi:hypothetical protein|nr:hypothetical protein [Oscillospiraceae bacterium]